MKKISVCAAVIRKKNRVLLCSRPDGTSMAGRWEFPGGKLKDKESDSKCLRREIREELGINIMPLDLIYSLEHEYPDKTVSLRFYRCTQENPEKEPFPMENQQIKWLDVEDLTETDLLPADIEFAKFLCLK